MKVSQLIKKLQKLMESSTNLVSERTANGPEIPQPQAGTLLPFRRWW